MGDFDLVIRFIVKLFDTWRVAGPLNEACNAEESAVSDNCHNIQDIVDVLKRVAIDQYEVCDSPHRDAAQERIGAECGGGVDTGGS